MSITSFCCSLAGVVRTWVSIMRTLHRIVNTAKTAPFWKWFNLNTVLMAPNSCAILVSQAYSSIIEEPHAWGTYYRSIAEDDRVVALHIVRHWSPWPHTLVLLLSHGRCAHTACAHAVEFSPDQSQQIQDCRKCLCEPSPLLWTRTRHQTHSSVWCPKPLDLPNIIVTHARATTCRCTSDCCARANVAIVWPSASPSCLSARLTPSHRSSVLWWSRPVVPLSRVISA